MKDADTCYNETIEALNKRVINYEEKAYEYYINDISFSINRAVSEGIFHCRYALLHVCLWSITKDNKDNNKYYTINKLTRKKILECLQDSDFLVKPSVETSIGSMIYISWDVKEIEKSKAHWYDLPLGFIKGIIGI